MASNSPDAACAFCGEAVSVPTSAAWPDRCPHCGVAPLSTGSGAAVGSMAGGGSQDSAAHAPANAAYRQHHERDYIERTIATVRNHQDADNCWPQWANIFADEIERLWEIEDRQKFADLAEKAMNGDV